MQNGPSKAQKKLGHHWGRPKRGGARRPPPPGAVMGWGGWVGIQAPLQPLNALKGALEDLLGCPVLPYRVASCVIRTSSSWVHVWWCSWGSLSLSRWSEIERTPPPPLRDRPTPTSRAPRQSSQLITAHPHNAPKAGLDAPCEFRDPRARAPPVVARPSSTLGAGGGGVAWGT
jgi:hypothetical protein